MTPKISHFMKLKMVWVRKEQKIISFIDIFSPDSNYWKHILVWKKSFWHLFFQILSQIIKLSSLKNSLCTSFYQTVLNTQPRLLFECWILMFEISCIHRSWSQVSKLILNCITWDVHTCLFYLSWMHFVYMHLVHCWTFENKLHFCLFYLTIWESFRTIVGTIVPVYC